MSYERTSMRNKLSGFRSVALSASRSIQGAVKNVSESVATVQANRAAAGPQGSFLGQVRSQIVIDSGKRREEEDKGTRRISLFPGWAVRRFEPLTDDSREVPPQFHIDVFVSGFAYSLRSPEQASRSQKAFLKIAKAFASLPKVPTSTDGPTWVDPLESLSRSTEDLLKFAHLPPRPDEMTPEMEQEILESNTVPLAPPRPGFLLESGSVSHLSSNHDAHPHTRSSTMYSHRNSSSTSVSTVSSSASATPSLAGTSFTGLSAHELLRLHANFDRRLQPFWARAVTQGTVKISLFTTNVLTGQVDRHHGPLATAEVPLSGDTGYFGTLFKIAYEDICTHPGGLHIAFGDSSIEHRLTVIAELVLPLLPSVPSPSSGSTSSNVPSMPSHLHIPIAPPRAEIRVGLSDARVRLISDIDDTIKLSGILHGVRVVFRNVFVRDLEELAVPGMPEFYQGLKAHGVRFHYVSNSPFELLPVLSQFLNVSGFPIGSLKLKFYGGRSIFKGLWEPAGERKRAGVVEVMDHFPDAKFFLVGDSGEQDLELYTSLAKEFHKAGRNQIIAIFIRNVLPETRSSGKRTSSRPSSPSPSPLPPIPPQVNPPRESMESAGTFFTLGSTPPVSDGEESPKADINEFSELNNTTPSELDRNNTVRASQLTRRLQPPLAVQRADSMQFTSVNTTNTGRTPRHQDSTDSGISDPALAAALAAASASTPSLTKKRAEFWVRLERARQDMPSDVPLVVFEQPQECVDIAYKALERLGLSHESTTL